MNGLNAASALVSVKSLPPETAAVIFRVVRKYPSRMNSPKITFFLSYLSELAARIGTDEALESAILMATITPFVDDRINDAVRTQAIEQLHHFSQQRALTALNGFLKDESE